VTNSLEYTPDELKYFAEVNGLINQRYYPLAEEARKTGRTITSDYISHLVRLEVEAELNEVAQLRQAKPHPRAIGAIAMPEVEELSHA
jgi:hypothetical protein